MTTPTALTAQNPPDTNHQLTWLGLGVSLFSMIMIRQVVHTISADPSPALVLARELAIFASAALLFWLVRSKEKLTLRSIGIGTAPVWKSLAWGVVIAVACLVPAALLSALTHYGHGAASQSFAKLPLWLLFLIVLRAGIVEEFFYRAYAIDRLQKIGAGRTAAWLIPLIIFSVAHWTGGAANVLIAFVLGGILTAFYQWRRDLLANMFGHFLVDFIANILPALLA
jgi:membrane protease YdiL (CAAX protease family)